MICAGALGGGLTGVVVVLVAVLVVVVSGVVAVVLVCVWVGSDGGYRERHCEPGARIRLPAGTIHAGVNSFGWGGTNAHVVVRSAPEATVQTKNVGRAPIFVPVSAHSEAAGEMPTPLVWIEPAGLIEYTPPILIAVEALEAIDGEAPPVELPRDSDEAMAEAA